MLICVKTWSDWKTCLVLFLLDSFSKVEVEITYNIISACFPIITNESLRDKYQIRNRIYREKKNGHRTPWIRFDHFLLLFTRVQTVILSL